MDLLTVTCLRDVKDIVRQAQSIQLYLEPCTHWIVVNEEHPDKEYWHSLIEPYYTRHTLKLVFPKWEPWFMRAVHRFWYEPKHPDGYKLQMVHKLMMVETIQDDYMIIDSDTFFTQPCSVNDWQDVIGSGRPLKVSDACQDPDIERILQKYAHKLQMNLPVYIFDNMVPYVFRKEVLNSLPNISQTVKWWNSQSGFQSEFFLYNLLAYKCGLYNDNVEPEYVSHSMGFHQYATDPFEFSPKWKALLFKEDYFQTVKGSREQVNAFLDSIGITQHY